MVSSLSLPFQRASSVSHNTLQTYDSLLRDSVQCITNSNLSDVQWLQASLPVRDGGLGGEMCVFARNSRLFGIAHLLKKGEEYSYYKCVIIT